MTDIEVLDGSAWRSIRYQDFSITFGVSDVQIAPAVEVDTDARETIDSGQQLRVVEAGTTIFQGRLTSSGKRRTQGARKLKAQHKAYELFEQDVSFSTSGSAEDVFRDALNAADGGGDFTLSYTADATPLADTYEADGRPLKQVYRDMTDRIGSAVWVVDGAGDEITVADYGDRGLWETLDAQALNQDARRMVVDSYEPDSIETVQNDITVNGTGAERVVGTAEDATSISQYGRRSKRVNVNYITSQGEADDYASALVIDQPLAQAKITVSAAVLSDVENLANFTANVKDRGTGLDDTLVIEKQELSQGKMTLTLGEGAGFDFETINRNSKSREDTTEPGSVYGEERISDGAINDNKIGENFALLLDEAVSANRALLQEATGDLDDIEDGTQFGRVGNESIDGNARIILSEVVGDLDDVDDGTNFGRVDTTAISPGGLVVANGVELNDGRRFEDLTQDDLQKNDATVIDGGEVLTGSITLVELDALDITTENLDFENDDGDNLLRIQTPADKGEVELLPQATFSRLGTDGDEWNEALIRNINPDTDDDGRIGNSFAAHSEIWAHDFINAVTGDSIISNDGGDPLDGLAADPRPPDHCRVCDDDGTEVGTSINKLTEELWSICTAQQRRLEDVEQRLSELEAAQ